MIVQLTGKISSRIWRASTEYTGHVTIILFLNRPHLHAISARATQNQIGMKAQARQKRQYDAKHNTNTKVNVGDKVLVRSMKNEGRKGGKLEPLFPGGPYVIAEDLGKGQFRLKDLNGKLLQTAINIHQLKLWNDPDGGQLKNDVSI